MDIKDILAKADHTQLAQTATWEDIKNLIDEAIEYKTASVCIPASYVKKAFEYAKGKTVTGSAPAFDILVIAAVAS